MTAILVFSPAASDFINGLRARLGHLEFTNNNPLLTVQCVPPMVVWPEQGWDIAVCWEPEPYNAYDREVHAYISSQLQYAQNGLARRNPAAGELIVLQHNSGNACHQDQDALIDQYFGGRPRATCKYSRIVGAGAFEALCCLAQALGQGNFEDAANRAVSLFRSVTVADLEAYVINHHCWRSFDLVRAWAETLRITWPAEYNAIAKETDLAAGMLANGVQETFLKLLEAIRKHPGVWV